MNTCIEQRRVPGALFLALLRLIFAGGPALMTALRRLRSPFHILATTLLAASCSVAALADYRLQPLSRPVHQAPNPTFADRFVAAAIERTHHIVRYDPAYVRIPYPGGDVAPST